MKMNRQTITTPMKGFRFVSAEKNSELVRAGVVATTIHNTASTSTWHKVLKNNMAFVMDARVA